MYTNPLHYILWLYDKLQQYYVTSPPVPQFEKSTNIANTQRPLWKL